MGGDEKCGDDRIGMKGSDTNAELRRIRGGEEGKGTRRFGGKSTKDSWGGPKETRIEGTLQKGNWFSGIEAVLSVIA